jgi:hypothetical protein
MIEIEDGFFIFPEKVFAVKAVGKKKCLLYPDGTSALDGFLLERNALEVAQEIVDGMFDEEMAEDGEEEDVEEDGNEEEDSSL